MAKMGIGILGSGNLCKRKFRWLFSIPEVTYDESNNGIDVLPPEKSARPNLEFKSMSVKHLSEDIYYPAKPDWKPVTLTLYDMGLNSHPVFEWIKNFYQPKEGIMYPPNVVHTSSTGQIRKFIKEATLRMYNGCGDLVERWIWEDAWLQSANFQTLDMGDSGVVTCDITMRYARAYVDEIVG